MSAETKAVPTPGPWNVRVHSSSGELRIGNDQPQVTIARMGMWVADEMSEQQANARLIAAAPMQHELLLALDEGTWLSLDKWAQRYGVDLQGEGKFDRARRIAIKAAVNRAEGQ